MSLGSAILLVAIFIPSWWNADTIVLGTIAVRRTGSFPVEGTLWPYQIRLVCNPLKVDIASEILRGATNLSGYGETTKRERLKSVFPLKGVPVEIRLTGPFYAVCTKAKLAEAEGSNSSVLGSPNLLAATTYPRIYLGD